MIIKLYYLFECFGLLIVFSYFFINPLTSTGEGVTIFTSPYLSAGSPALGEAKGLIINNF